MGTNEGRENRSMRRGVAVLLLSLIAGAAAPGLAADAGETAGTSPMEGLAKMVGTWTGTGWSQRGPDRHEFRSRETVESRLGGSVILVEGLHHSSEDGSVVHHALAMISWDEDEGGFRFRSTVAGRGDGDFRGSLEDGVFVWGGSMGPGEMRYEITIENDTWSEIGKFSRDGGTTWTPFFGMELERQP